MERASSRWWPHSVTVGFELLAIAQAFLMRVNDLTMMVNVGLMMFQINKSHKFKMMIFYGCWSKAKAGHYLPWHEI